MKKTILLVIATTVSVVLFSQEKAAFINPSAMNVLAKASGKDTLVIEKAPFIKLPDGNTINTEALQAALKSGFVVQPDEYWNLLYAFIKTSKNGDFTSAQQDELVKPWIFYVQRYQKAQEAKKPKQ